MAPPRTSSLVLSASWPHYLGIFVTILSIFAGLARYTLLDWSDPIHCDVLMKQGSWLDTAQRNWQPDGCMLHSYTPNDGATCLGSKDVVFIGDSITRTLFFHLAHILDPVLPVSPPDDDRKHSDHTLNTAHGNTISFFWDPFLNRSDTHDLMGSKMDNSLSESEHEKRRPALVVLGSGLWYLRYANTSGGLPSWEANMERLLETLAHGRMKPADEVVLLPVEEVVASKLDHERAMSMRSSDIEAMNSDLFHRTNPLSHNFLPIFSSSVPAIPIALPFVFNQMLSPSETEDGLHFSDALVGLQANILLNFRCNNNLPKVFPLNKTCCSGYPRPAVLQFIILGVAVLWGQRGGTLPWANDGQLSTLIFSGAIALIFIADRTGFWLKEQKQFSPWVFGFLCLVSLTIGLITIKRVDKDLGFLNREQTDEWKGWMQIAILIYHYCGASKISGIYNPIRVLVASYLFMTGYGHTTFYLRKADFGFLRIAQVIVRLNLLTIVLAYTMNTDYISYYFSPLVSMWFLIIYGTMALGSQLNDRTTFLVCKLLLSAGIVTWFMSEAWLLETLFEFLRRVCGIHWSAREWAFRVNLDLWIVYVGMFSALTVLKVREHRLTDHPRWPLAVKSAIGLASVAILWFFGFELYQESKFTYNTWHPYISFVPILAFVVLRNASVILRCASSHAFAFVGRCSLETFIIQYHFWLAGDTKGVLLVIPGTQRRPINFMITTIMFIYVSDRMAHATTEITTWICGGAPKSLALPTTASTPTAPSSSLSRQDHNISLHLGEGQDASIPLISPNSSSLRKNDENDVLPPEPDTPVRDRRWVDRLADESAPYRPSGFRAWHPGVKTKLTMGVGIMWLANILWY